MLTVILLMYGLFIFTEIMLTVILLWVIYIYRHKMLTVILLMYGLFIFYRGDTRVPYLEKRLQVLPNFSLFSDSENILSTGDIANKRSYIRY